MYCVVLTNEPSGLKIMRAARAVVLPYRLPEGPGHPECAWPSVGKASLMDPGLGRGCGGCPAGEEPAEKKVMAQSREHADSSPHPRPGHPVSTWSCVLLFPTRKFKCQARLELLALSSHSPPLPRPPAGLEDQVGWT